MMMSITPALVQQKQEDTRIFQKDCLAETLILGSVREALLKTWRPMIQKDTHSQPLGSESTYTHVH